MCAQPRHLCSCRLTAARPALRLRGGAVESLVARRSPTLVAAKTEEAPAKAGIDFGLLAAFAGWCVLRPAHAPQWSPEPTHFAAGRRPMHRALASGTPVGVLDYACASSRPPHTPPLPHRYVGNYYYTLNNKLALKAAGGATGFPVTIGFMQLLIGSVYALFLWLAPDCRPLPQVSMDDVMKVRPLKLPFTARPHHRRVCPGRAEERRPQATCTERIIDTPLSPCFTPQVLPVAGCAAGAHLASIFSMNLGAVSFAQIVKASEPAFAAVVGTTLYGKSISQAKWLCLIPVIGGVCLASIKELGEPA